VLRSEIPSSICAKLHTVAASNKRSCVAISLTIACLPSVYNGVIVHAHPVCGESHNQRNTTGEVATTFPPFYNKPHRSHVLCVKAELGTTLHIMVTAPFCCDRKSRAAYAQSFAPWQQATTEIMCRNLSYYCLLAFRI